MKNAQLLKHTEVTDDILNYKDKVTGDDGAQFVKLLKLLIQYGYEGGIHMDEKIVKQIFLQNNLGEVKSIKKIEIGFTNKVYLINNEFILKVCEDEENEDNFEKEVFFYDFFKDKIPVPQISVYDNSKKVYNKFFMIYPKIQGDNLYSKWHLMSNSERRDIIRQLCEILRVINKSSYEEFTKRFKLNSSVNWHDRILDQIQNSLKKIEDKKIISTEFVQAIKNFIKENHNVLTEQKIALVYWDAHFDNILIQGNIIVGILDFERTNLSSIDFALDTIRRMAEYPKKYMSKEFRKFAKKEDYAKLLEWFHEFYPELFEFKNLGKRLDLYAIEHDLKDLIGWPNDNEVKQMIAKTINYNSLTF
ncbi:Phosphotransferase enzyme family protein [Caldanaerobius fijiensis DSM 17918]|uniref:Phosphotransferase enzyme family protein n=1 Tax=Caldanaerobius fijiensis DSM 17918 TaxID=1121256 RepID=A0A1M4ZM49_9THEO|nr:aminoglycoside phosphotransferase family protein [Caldanaerobius fijiensis]SHF19160.1 Phosphotransferase enzyme family protein [Caldanaerobius fijiensis DSM 17918]